MIFEKYIELKEYISNAIATAWDISFIHYDQVPKTIDPNTTAYCLFSGWTQGPLKGTPNSDAYSGTFDIYAVFLVGNTGLSYDELRVKRCDELRTELLRSRAPGGGHLPRVSELATLEEVDILSVERVSCKVSFTVNIEVTRVE